MTASAASPAVATLSAVFATAVAATPVAVMLVRVMAALRFFYPMFYGCDDMV
jgi:hypothetical protein